MSIDKLDIRGPRPAPVVGWCLALVGMWLAAALCGWLAYSVATWIVAR